ncbi:MAG: hypothetical protein ACRDJO_12670 [Actinomycetota bacterium]
MSRLPSPLRRLFAALLAVVAASCGGRGGGGPTPQAWMTTLCGALVKWQGVMTDLPPLPRDDLAAAKNVLGELLDNAVTSTDELIRTIRGAGAPDVENGAELAQGYQTALTSIRDSLDNARTKAQALDPAKPEEFGAGLTTIVTELEAATSALGRTFDENYRKYKSEELDNAAKEVEECNELVM